MTNDAANHAQASNVALFPPSGTPPNPDSWQGQAGGGQDGQDGQSSVQDIINDIDYLLSPPGASPTQLFTCYIEGIPFEIRRMEQEHGPMVQIQAVLGFLPYTAESTERREALLQILQGAKRLINVRFGLDRAGKIVMVGKFADETIVAPDFIFFPLMKFMQEAKPFIALIGRYL